MTDYTGGNGTVNADEDFLRRDVGLELCECEAGTRSQFKVNWTRSRFFEAPYTAEQTYSFFATYGRWY